MLEILLISAGAVLETLFIMRSYKRRDVSSVVLKTAASVVFVLLGLLELRRMGPSVYEWYVVAGLTLGMLGDLLLALRFLSEKLHRLFFAAGSVSFFLGHIVYILAILTLCPAAWLYAIPIAVVALGAACFYAYAKEVRAGRITPLGVVYIGSVLFMTACAATGAFIESSRALFLFFVGGICFSASDNMLVVLSFGKNDSPYRNAVLHVLYYMAQHNRQPQTWQSHQKVPPHWPCSARSRRSFPRRLSSYRPKGYPPQRADPPVPAPADRVPHASRRVLPSAARVLYAQK